MVVGAGGFLWVPAHGGAQTVPLLLGSLGFGVPAGERLQAVPSASLLDALRWILDTFEFVAEAQISGFRQSRFPEGGG